MIWNPEYESMGRPELEELQLRRLQSTVAWVYERVPYYRAALDELGVRPRDIRTLADVTRLPFTDKSALRDTYPFGLFAVPIDQVVRIHSSSGTTGKPIVVGYTKGDIATWTELTARVASAAGVVSTDLAQMAFGYGMFTGGFGMHYGLERVGATVIPASAGNTERHLMMMADFGTTVLISTPSYALYIAEVGAELGVDFEQLPLRLGLFGAEPCSEAARREIEAKLHIRATDNYGLSEVMGPGVAGECLECRGLHINEDHFLLEILDPATLEPVPEGEVGELVITTLTKEAFPMVRYRTRDLTRFIPGTCACGRTMKRMERVMGRSDDMLIIKGVNVFPMQIEKVLFEVEGTEPHYQILVERENHADKITVLVEVVESIFFDEMKKQRMVIDRIKSRLASEVGISVEVKLVEEKTLERSEGKAKRVIDRRKL